MDQYSLCLLNPMLIIPHAFVLLDIYMLQPVRAIKAPEVGLAHGKKVRPETSDDILGDVKCCHDDEQPKEELGHVLHDLIEERRDDHIAAASIEATGWEILGVLASAVSEDYSLSQDDLDFMNFVKNKTDDKSIFNFQIFHFQFN